jgi:hypothetical protein
VRQVGLVQFSGPGPAINATCTLGGTLMRPGPVVPCADEMGDIEAQHPEIQVIGNGSFCLSLYEQRVTELLAKCDRMRSDRLRFRRRAVPIWQGACLVTIRVSTFRALGGRDRVSVRYKNLSLNTDTSAPNYFKGSDAAGEYCQYGMGC